MGPYRSLNIPKSSSLYIAQNCFFYCRMGLTFPKTNVPARKYQYYCNVP